MLAKLISGLFFAIFLWLATGESSLAFDTYNIAKENHVVPLSGDVGADIVLGLGLNLDDPDNLMPVPSGPFVVSHPDPQPPPRSLDKNQILTSSTSFLEGASDYEFSRFLRANMRSSFSFVSGAAAFDYVREVKKTSDVILAIIKQTTASPAISASNIVWPAAPASERIANPAERLHQFVADYGSHYVQSIRYGFKIAIYGRKQTSGEKERQDFRAAFKSAFGSGAAPGSVDSKVKQQLEATDVELRAEVTAGDIEPKSSIMFNGFDQIVEFLNKIRSGEVVLYPGPIEVIAKSYWHTLVAYPKTREVLAPMNGEVAAPYGVARGAIIAWAPPAEAIIRKDDTTVDVIAPSGWAICDGSHGTPDLVDRFILGSLPKSAGEKGGSETHELKINTKIVKEPGEFYVSSQSPRMTIRVYADTPPLKTLPPYFKLIYIMRL